MHLIGHGAPRPPTSDLRLPTPDSRLPTPATTHHIGYGAHRAPLQAHPDTLTDIFYCATAMPFISPKRLLYYCPASIAGTARNAIEQAIALGRAGVEVTFLAPTDFDYVGETPNVVIDRCLRPGPRSGRLPRWLSRLKLSLAILTNQWRLRRILRASGMRHVMFASYSEYLAPLWAPWLRCLQRQGVRFFANLLDPVRDYVVGPIWWHQWSVNEGFSFLTGVFVHQVIELDVQRADPKLSVTVVPHGAY